MLNKKLTNCELIQIQSFDPHTEIGRAQNRNLTSNFKQLFMNIPRALHWSIAVYTFLNAITIFFLLTDIYFMRRKRNYFFTKMLEFEYLIPIPNLIILTYIILW